MNRHGWDQYRKEGLVELGRIKESLTLANSFAQKEILDRYIEIYREKNELGICAASLCSDSVKDKQTESDVQKYIHSIISRLKPNIDKFYLSDEGKNSAFEMYFIAEKGDYKLGVRPRKKTNQTFDEVELVKYNEREHFIIKAKPTLITIVSIVFLVISSFFVVGALLIYFVATKSMIYFVSLPLLLFGIFLLYAGIVLNKVPSRRLVNVVGKYFFKIKQQELSLVSYRGKCTVKGCPGFFSLSNNFQKGSGYIAACSEYPSEHRYNIDTMTLQGTRIKMP